MATSQSDRCGYELDLGLADKAENEVVSTEPCDRPVWEDHDRCVWHAKVDRKTSDQLEEADPSPGDNLDGAYLKEAELVGIDWLAGRSLIGANLSDATINSIDLTEADLRLASLTSISGIYADFTETNLEGAIFTNADLRRATLTDARLNETVLTDVHIGDKTDFGDVTIYEQNSTQPELSDDHPLEAAAWAYRQLEQLYQANALPELAQRSYNREKDVRRRLAWAESDYGEALKRELSRWVTRYGSSPYRILAVSLLVITVAAVLFPFTGGLQESQGEQVITYTLDNPEEVPRWWIGKVLFKSFYFSVVTFTTLGYGDIQPIGQPARLIAGVETVLGSLLSALLVFVLARIVTW